MIASDYNYLVREKRLHVKQLERESTKKKRFLVISLILITANVLINIF